MTRTFIALELDDAQQQFLSRIIRQGKHVLSDLHWVDPTGIHLTLVFLGELDDMQLAKTVDATRYAASRTHPFAYTLSGLGTFGTPRQPRVLWMGVSNSNGMLETAQRTLSSALELEGFPGEKRPFSPHLTLARIKSPLSPEKIQLRQQLLAKYQFASPPYQVNHISVMKSELARSGARYSRLEMCPLQG